MSPKSRGRPAGRGRPRRPGQTGRQVSLVDHVYRSWSPSLSTDVLAAERWASTWLGSRWVLAPMGDREPELPLCQGVAARALATPTPATLGMVAALRRVAPESMHPVLDGPLQTLRSEVPAPSWLDDPAFYPSRAWQAVDPWASERVLLVDYGSHMLMADVLEPGGTYVVSLGLFSPDAVDDWNWDSPHSGAPMPLTAAPVEDVLADLANALRRTDMTIPRNDDDEFVPFRALAWSRCRDHVRPLGEIGDDVLPYGDQDALVEEFMTHVGGEDVAAVRSVANTMAWYSVDYIRPPLAWSPDWVELFLGDWLPRKALLEADERRVLPDTLRQWLTFCLARRGVAAEWVAPVLAAVEPGLDRFVAEVDDPSTWGPAKQIAAELAARNIDPTDKAAVDRLISELNAVRLANLVRESTMD